MSKNRVKWRRSLYSMWTHAAVRCIVPFHAGKRPVQPVLQPWLAVAAMAPVVISEPFVNGAEPKLGPTGQLVGMRIEVRTEPRHQVVAFRLGTLGDQTRVVVAKLVGMAAHHPVASTKAADDFAMGDAAKSVICLARNVEIPFMQVDQ